MLSFFRDRAYSLTEIRQTLNEDTDTRSSFFQLLQKHHMFLKESIPVLLDKIAPMDVKQNHLTRLLHLLAMHAKAEEETLYQALLASAYREAHLEGIAGQDEHQIAYQLAADLEELNFESNWSEEADAKSKVLASVLENHLKEEERGMFHAAKKVLDPELLKKLKAEYIDKCKHYLDVELGATRPLMTNRMIERGL